MSQLQSYFRPTPASTVNITVSASSQRVQPFAVNASPNEERALRIVNTGSATVWVECGDVTVTASATASMAVPAAGSLNIRVDGSQLYVACIAAGATGVVYFTPGA